MAANNQIVVAADQLVRTKLHLPHVRGTLVCRPRLVERLCAGLQTPLTLIAAPAGYGKTTLVSTWRSSGEAGSQAMAWLSLDPDDNRPARFLRYLVAALAEAGLPADSLASRLLRGRRPPKPSDFAMVLVNEILEVPHEVVLFLDDYHAIQDGTVNEVVAYLVEHAPPNLHTVLLSRTDPSLPLERLRARGQLVEIRFDDLRFTADEIEEFFRETAHVNLSIDEVTRLEANTEGWVTALQLTALAAQGRPLSDEFARSQSGNNRFVIDYLMAEVVSHQPDEIREFLGVSAVLERMCAPLCDSLLELSAAYRGAGADSAAGRSAEILRRLDQSNLFVIRLDETGDWYRYHHLFRDFLRSRLGESGPGASALHKRASAWYQEKGLVAEAMSHAFASSDWDYAADVLESCGLPILMASEIRTIFDWTDAFPAEVIRVRPMLSILHAWSPALSYCRASRSRVEEYIHDAEQAADRLDDEEKRRRYRGHAALVRCFLAMIPDVAVQPDLELLQGQQALDLFPEDDPIRCTCELPISYAYLAMRDTASARLHLQEARRLAGRGPDYFCEVDATFHEIQIAHEQGLLHEVVREGCRARSYYAALLQATDQQVPAVGSLDIAIGCALAEQDSLVAAEEYLLKGLAVVDGCSDAYYQMLGYVVLARLREAQGRLADADQCLVQLEDAWPDIAFLTRAVRVRQLLRTASGSPEALKAAYAFSDVMTPFAPSGEMHVPGLGPCGSSEAYYRAYLSWVYAQIALGRPAEALKYLDSQLDVSIQHGLANRVIGLSVAKAVALQASGQSKHAREVFRTALAHGESECYVRVFDEGPWARQLLDRFAVEPGPQQEFASYVLSRLYPKTAVLAERADAGSVSDSPDVGGVLMQPDGEVVGLPTHRELDVLRLVASGRSNAEIAGELFIEVGTVKQHLNRAMHKLHAASRTEAVARGRLLGLLDS